MNRGVIYATGAYLIWGVLPIYWKALHDIPALQIISNRIVWTVVFLGLVVVYRKEAGVMWGALRVRGRLPVVLLSAGLLAINWLVYIWGVNAGYIVETSLGYFINPLVNVLLGVIFLRERLRPWQWLPVGLAATGVLYLTFNYGALPWIALVLAFSFSIYGLVKKTAPLNSLHGLTLETGAMFIPALVYLLWFSGQGNSSVLGTTWLTTLLLVLTGVITALPLLLFGLAAQRIPLTMIGILQYIAPTCQFLIGVFIYHEDFSTERLVGFILIWLALVLFTFEGLAWRRAGRRAQAQSSANS